MKDLGIPILFLIFKTFTYKKKYDVAIMLLFGCFCLFSKFLIKNKQTKANIYLIFMFYGWYCFIVWIIDRLHYYNF